MQFCKYPWDFRSPNQLLFCGSKIKRHLADKFNKHNLPALKKAVAALEGSGFIVNTGRGSGGAGHYQLNVDYENFDTRGRYLDDKDPAKRVSRKDKLGTHYNTILNI